MTTLASIFGFLHLRLPVGDGWEMLQPLAASMIGGISLSILLSLVSIPGLSWVLKGRSV